jgi:hypothetical protein
MPDTLSRSDQNTKKKQKPASSCDPEPDCDEWDRQIEEDAKAGRLDALAERARAHCREGNVTDLDGNPA